MKFKRIIHLYDSLCIKLQDIADCYNGCASMWDIFTNFAIRKRQRLIGIVVYTAWSLIRQTYKT